MIKFNKIKIFGIIAIIVIVVAVVFVIDQKDTEVERTDQEDAKDVTIDSKNFVDQILSTKEIKEMIPSRSISESEMQGWKHYTSEILGISFRYSPQYIVVEAKKPTTHTIGTSVSLSILEDTPYNRHRAKILNPDFDYDIPEDQKNADIEPSSGTISLSKSIAGDATQGIEQWVENNFRGIGDRNVHGFTDFIGIHSLIFQAEGLFIFDGVIFEREGYLYQFGVQYGPSDDRPESPRTDFYKIISTTEFE